MSPVNLVKHLGEPFEWVYVPSGSTLLQYPPYIRNDQNNWVTDYEVIVDSFYIAKYPITNSQFSIYVREIGKEPHTQYWKKANFDQPLQPVIDISWLEAMEFCNWITSKVDFLITLPADAQWQRAAQGDDNRKYPWGNEWNSLFCNMEDSKIGHTTPVTQFPNGQSPYGVMDMIGNVFEWCLTNPSTGLNLLNTSFSESSIRSEERIFKGSSCYTSKYSCDTAKYGAAPISTTYVTGIRLVTT